MGGGGGGSTFLSKHPFGAENKLKWLYFKFKNVECFLPYEVVFMGQY